MDFSKGRTKHWGFHPFMHDINKSHNVIEHLSIFVAAVHTGAPHPPLPLFGLSVVTLSPQDK